MRFGPNKDSAKAYRPGRAKLLAKRNVQKAAINSTIPFPSLQVVRIYI